MSNTWMSGYVSQAVFVLSFQNTLVGHPRLTILKGRYAHNLQQNLNSAISISGKLIPYTMHGINFPKVNVRSVYEPSGPSGRHCTLVYAAWSDQEYCCSHLDGMLLGSLSSYNGDANQNVTRKTNFTVLQLLTTTTLLSQLVQFVKCGQTIQELNLSGQCSNSDRQSKIHLRVLTFSIKLWIWSFHVVVLQRTAKKCTKM